MILSETQHVALLPNVIEHQGRAIGIRLKSKDLIQAIYELTDYILEAKEYSVGYATGDITDLYIFKSPKGGMVLTDKPEYFFDCGASLVLMLKGNQSLNRVLDPDLIGEC